VNGHIKQTTRAVLAVIYNNENNWNGNKNYSSSAAAA